MLMIRASVILGIFCALVTLQANTDYINKRLLDAAEKGDLETIVDCVKDSEIGDAAKACDINVLNEAGFSPLMLAARSGHEHVIDQLLGFKANVHVQNRFGETALSIAVGYGQGGGDPKRVNIIQKLLDAGAYIGECDEAGNLTLSQVLPCADIETVKTLSLQNVLNIRKAQLRKNIQICSVLLSLEEQKSMGNSDVSELPNWPITGSFISRGANDFFAPYARITNHKFKAFSTLTRPGYKQGLRQPIDFCLAKNASRTLRFLFRASKR